MAFESVFYCQKDIGYSTDIHALNYSDLTQGTKEAITAMIA